MTTNRRGFLGALAAIVPASCLPRKESPPLRTYTFDCLGGKAEDALQVFNAGFMPIHVTQEMLDDCVLKPTDLENL